MTIILDADVVIRSEKGTFDLQNWVVSRPNDQFEILFQTGIGEQRWERSLTFHRL